MGELFEERKKNLIDAISFKEPDKIPVGVQMSNWAFAYAGVRYEDIIDDPDRVVETFTKHLRDFDFDYVQTGISVPIEVYQALGSKNYVFTSDGCCIEHNQTQIKYMTAEDYDLLINDTANFSSEILPKRNGEIYQKPFGEAYEMFKNAARKALQNEEVTARIQAVVKEREFITPFSGGDTPRFMSPFNSIFDRYRGIVDALADIRRRPEKVDEACAVLLANTLKGPAFTRPKDHYDPYPMARATCHSECFLNQKDFDKYFMTPFRDHYMQFVEKGGRYYMRGEGRFKKNIEVMTELPKGTITIMLDKDDPFEMYPIMKDKIPIACGITSSLLKFGTVDECKDYVKKCFDTFAPGGGFIFAQNEGLLAANDAKVENFIAVFETAHELSRQK
ncbi:MAG: hypothetical protein IKD81_00245 [Eubacteriaceae bacterium]|nr:hypothetical protein [Eubacteriaceae bacterium]MBR2779846.1 hypothetical protein [Eubacteriaceae bacterium]MCR4894251.1 hypothetical protein [Eubacteriales bacterium]